MPITDEFDGTYRNWEKHSPIVHSFVWFAAAKDYQNQQPPEYNEPKAFQFALGAKYQFSFDEARYFKNEQSIFRQLLRGDHTKFIQFFKYHFDNSFQTQFSDDENPEVRAYQNQVQKLLRQQARI